VNNEFDDSLGLVITDDHLATIDSLDAVPLTFRAKDMTGIPESWESPIPAWNQGSTSSCAGHAGAANFTHRQFVETGEIVKYSPWFSYLTSQKRGNFFGRDGGTSIRSVIDSATLDGCCLESLCQRPNRYDTTISAAAIADAAAHKHNGKPVDLRDWDTLMDWLTDLRSVVIGTKWMSSQSTIRDVETLALGSGGSFRGYHARALIGWKTINGQRCPRVMNSHGTNWGTNGRATITHELWDWWKRDSNFVALGFTDINERIPKRRDWSGFNFAGSVVPNWAKSTA
jgi:hypothetical protein